MLESLIFAAVFTLIEVLIALIIFALVAMAGYSALSPTNEARLVACYGDLDAMNTIVDDIAEQTFPYIPDQATVMNNPRWDDDFT